ncbi:MAG: nicotinate phosphoribosyltransferase [Coriobacteriia bacterium]|nr:nicotinate phosphoribosyltransferase [Coriobacteriia bacterium]MCL2746474.1 nicotinate phosphoribosyltransferase [Coriobacteriia bacterium]MCL2870820.1 nicotinate phosphoribosyltransferase [Coriobacteriia bacterium]
MTTNPLLIDLYQLTMAQGYFREGMQEAQASFTYSFREHPFKGGFAVFAGLYEFGNHLENWSFSTEDIQWLSSLKAADGTVLFGKDFLEYLKKLQVDQLEISAVSEGSIVFAGEPLLRVTGSLIVTQLLETTLMNRLNFETLIATKAARCYIAAGGDPVLEFGLRRAQGPDGGISASRAAYIGGCSATSNLEAGRKFGLPVAGTHAHSWVMAHTSEEEAFESWTRSAANNSILLVDTYNSEKGIEQAVKAGAALEARGGTFAGVRLDSGDLAWLSRRARKMLDSVGLEHAKIYASNNLDEHTILSLKSQGAMIDSWGVGTRLATGGDQSALGGVYKMTAMRPSPTDSWEPKIKVSDQSIKTSIPGILAVRRFLDYKGRPVGDMIYDLNNPPAGGAEVTIVDPRDVTRQKNFDAEMDSIELLKPFFRGGSLVQLQNDIHEIRENCLANLAVLDKSHQRFMRPHLYPVGLERNLFEKRLEMITRHKGVS